MKKTEQKLEYIKLRAEGKSYRAIEAEIGIAKSTCSEWDKELRGEIDELKKEQLEEIYNSYGMAKEARIRRIGETLNKIDQALAEVDFKTIAPEKLLDYKLKYQAALRDEYSVPAPETSGAPKDTLEALQGLYRRLTIGETSTDQAKSELNVIDHIVDANNRNTPLSEMFGF